MFAVTISVIIAVLNMKLLWFLPKTAVGFWAPLQFLVLILLMFAKTEQGRFYVGAGERAPDSLVAPDSNASWPFWRDFWGPKMLQN